MRVEIAKCKRDLKYWLFNWCITEDSQSQDPYRLFPRSPHTECVADYWNNYNRCIIVKSRQMTQSWQSCAMYLWESMFIPSRTTFFASRKEIDSEALCQRTHFMYTKQPDFLKDFVKCEKTSCKLEFSNRSIIRGIAQGADQFRSYTLSGLLIDEASFQEELPDMIKAAIPAVGQRGRITVVSSAAPSYFADMVFDRS